MISPARVAAYQVSLAVSSGGADLPSALAGFRQSLTDERDRALAARIATGVQRSRAALDHLIVHFSRRALDRLDPEIVEILRLSAYQLVHLTRVPAAAIVDDGVALARRAGKKSAAGFVNAVLRAVSRNRHALPLPQRPVRLKPDTTADVRSSADVASGFSRTFDREKTLDYLSVTLSHPRWLAARWLDRYGLDRTEQWMQFNNEAAPLTLRANRFRTTRDDLQARLASLGITTAPGRFAPDALVVQTGNPLASDSDGGFVVQDEASQLVTLLAGDTPGPRVLDTCASPGGKATAIASALSEGGRLVACDVRQKRLDLLRRTIHATGAPNILLVQADLQQPLPFSAVFDCVIVDAPCSGLGILRRDPDIRWRRSEADLGVLSAAQGRMLQHAAEAVAPGGRLVYATCSTEPEENERIVDAFLANAGAFSLRDARTAHPLLPAAVVDERGLLRTVPDVHGLEGFFGAVLEKRLP